MQGASGPRKGLRLPVRCAYCLLCNLFRPAQRTQAQKEDALPRLNLEYQRKQARALLKRARAKDPDALHRFRSSGSVAATNVLSLHDAHRVVARENGFASWAGMRAHIRAESLHDPLMLSALVVAANRALETTLAPPLYRDPFAQPLAGDVGRSVLARLREASWPGYSTGPDPYLTIVTRFFDDALHRVLTTFAIDQVVLLRAGMDTRAFRLGWPPCVTVFEVDRADVFAHKEAVLDEVRARATCQRQIVAADPRGSWTRSLRKAGFDSARPAAFLIEGLHDLDPDDAERLIRDVTTVAGRGSWMGLALASELTLLSVFMTPYLRKIMELGLPPWKFGVDDPETWLAAFGWAASSVVAGDPEVSYGRWPYGYVPRGTQAIPRAFFTQAWLRDKEATWRGSL